MGRLTDRVAVVTGAGAGLGRAIAVKLAQEGAALVIGDIVEEGLRGTADSIESGGGQVCQLVGDSTESATAQALIAHAVSNFGRIDVLVNNVGGPLPGKIWELDEDTWDSVIRTNLRSMFLCTRWAAPHMMAQGYGRIVSVSSGARDGSPWQAAQGAAPYSTAKAGVHGFTREVALELAEYGVNVNAVAPGPIATERARTARAQIEETDLSALKLTPLRRYGEPYEVADAVAFLASDEASYITGQTLSVTGGR